ncbi:alpha/beta hydrolase [Arenibacter sp. F26102]|uniref:alpha/beta fold hydrolase n=1 Tax=Arenibacter sp. F26102 TaxID=2926416 RepID=UPI001FF4A0A7|nr:alpha/beta hydrolase [Arenibacter sp. F26102]MCK0146673.1 alpha/beta hydrolase [Arenibacter sp. F26102]
MQLKLIPFWTFILTLTTLMSQDVEKSELFLPQSQVSLSYTQAGMGDRTIVLIHGLGSNSKAFDKNFKELSKKALVIAVDLPGFGDTELGEFVPGIENYAEAIAEFITLKKYTRVTLIGHSMGGQLAMQLAAKNNPEWLYQLILLAPAGVEKFTDTEKNWFYAVVNEQLYLNLTDAQIKQNFDLNFYGGQLPQDAQFMLEDRLVIKEDLEIYKTYIATVVKSIYAMLNEPVYDKISKIKVPITVIYGKDDKLIPNKILHPQLSIDNLLEVLNTDYPQVSIIQLDQAGHFVHWDQSDSVNNIILKKITE